jgi:surfeit locus 1 family protein
VRRTLGSLFSPHLVLLHLLGLAATGAAIWLGLWQLDAWQAQREAEARDLSDLPAVALQQVIEPDDPFPAAAVGRPVTFTGRWLPRSTFYVSAREYDGRDGLWAVTPAAVCEDTAACASSAALLVARGWTAHRDGAPEPPEGPVELTGWLQPPEGRGYPDPDRNDDVLPEVRIADAIQRVDQDLYGAFLIAEQATPPAGLDGLVAVTPESLPEPASDTGLRNLLYGVQWFVFAAFAVFLWWRWVSDEIERSRRAGEVAAAEAAAGEEAEDAEVPSEP